MTKPTFKLYFKSDYRTYRVVYQVFAYAAVKKVGKPLSAVRTHTYQVGINAVCKMQHTFFYINIVIHMSVVTISNGKPAHKIMNKFLCSVS